MKIFIETIDHASQRYPTAGDWFFEDDGTLHITVSKLRNINQEWCVAVHELLEALICVDRGITQQDVDRFDMGNPALREPGDSPNAPYYHQHQFASAVERLLANELAVDWNDYNAALDAL